MKFENYERPELEELDLLLEDSCLNMVSPGEENPDVPGKPGEEGGDNWD